MKLVVRLPIDRRRLGILSLMDDSGRSLIDLNCLGRADQTAAAKHTNPTADPLKPYRHTPIGEYKVLGYLKTGDITHPVRSYGQGSAISLQPTGGHAFMAAQNGRTGLLIHGGDPKPSGGLRPTNGCIRLSNEDITALMSTILSQGGLSACRYPRNELVSAGKEGGHETRAV